MSEEKRPRVLIAASASGSGKTTVTVGIAACLASRGMIVRPYKTGPDYIDAEYIGAAAGASANNLDSWLTGEREMKNIFFSTSKGADISIIEGVMGLYDGGRGGVSSTAQIAKLLKAPVILVVNVRSMGESAAALVKGFRDYDKEVSIKGVIINGYGSETHGEITKEAIERLGLPVLGAVRRDAKALVKERHLGLLPRFENGDEKYFENIRKLISKAVDIDAIIKTANEAPPLCVAPQSAAVCSPKVKIAVARDEAFSFYYEKSVDVLKAKGAEIINFSPLRDGQIPDCDGLIFGGGFPEVFAGELSSNRSMRASVALAAKAGVPIYSECGGYMYLTREIKDFDGISHEMCGVIPSSCKMNDRLRTVGYVTAKALSDNVIAKEGTELRGHEFHFSNVEEDGGEASRAFLFTKNRNGERYAAGYAKENVLGSYLHLHFAGFPEAAENFVKKCEEYKSANK